MGYDPYNTSQGLGRHGQGVVEPVRAVRNRGEGGLGLRRQIEDAEEFVARVEKGVKKQRKQSSDVAKSSKRGGVKTRSDREIRALLRTDLSAGDDELYEALGFN
jgi:hypothetical protein